VALLVGSALLAGCGGSSSSHAGGQGASRPASPSASHGPSLAERVCGGARQAAAKTLGSPLTARIASPAPAGLQCVLTGREVQVTVGSQAGTRAYTEFDTETAHQEQVYGNGGVHDPSQFPTPITVPGSVVAVWIPAQLLLVATNATPTTGGAPRPPGLRFASPKPPPARRSPRIRTGHRDSELIPERYLVSP
jgi:hypothetical protein